MHLVLTGDSFPVPYGVLPVSHDEHALCRDKVRFVGDPVAAVIARDEATAAEAVHLIDVEYEPLRTFAGPADSLAHSEPRIHDYGDGGNVHKAVSLQFGDVDAAIAGADHVFDDVFFFEGSTHLPIEQHAAAAAKDPDGSRLGWPGVWHTTRGARPRPVCRRCRSRAARRRVAVVQAGRPFPPAPAHEPGLVPVGFEYGLVIVGLFLAVDGAVQAVVDVGPRRVGRSREPA